MSQIESSTESLAPERMSRATEIAGERMIKLASALNTRYKQSGNIQDLENVILCYRYSLRRLCPPGRPGCLDCFMNLTTALHTRYRHFGNSKDLNEAISLLLGLFRSCPLGHSDRWFSLNNLAGALLTRYDDFGNANDLKDGISLYREALSLCHHGHPNRASSLTNLAAALSEHYRKWGDVNDLENSISFHREAVSLIPPGQPYYSTALNNLATALEIRYSSFGNANDLEECISLLRNTLSLRPHGNPDRSVALNNIARALGVRYNNLGNADDLEESISIHRESLSLHPCGHPRCVTSLNNLALVLTTRYDNLGITNDLEDSISFLRETLTLSSPDHPDHSASLNAIAGALSSRYDKCGNANDLEDSIFFHREALSLCPPGHSLRPSSLNNLAGALNTRYRKLGDANDLEDGISFQREALSLCPPGHPYRSTSLANLATALDSRYRKFGNGKDLNDSISFHLQAVSLLPLEHPNRPASLDGLGAALRTQYAQPGNDDDLEACIFALHCASLHLWPPGHPARSSSLKNLANTLKTCYDKFSNTDDLKSCISLQREALSLCPHGNASHSVSLTSLGILLITLSRHVQMGRPEDVSEAFLCFSQAASDSTSYIHNRLEAAVCWVHFAHVHNHETIFSAYTALFQLINHSLIFHSNVETQQRFLANANIPRSLASDAAAAAVAGEKIELAVEFLEQGRALLWSKVDAYKHPLDELRQATGGAKIADRLQAISAKLEHLSFVSSSATLNKESSEKAAILDNRMREHRVLSEEWEVLVQKVRKIDGFSHFLRAAPFNILQSASDEGPVILVNVSEYRSDAIILLKDIPPQLVNLPEVLLPELCGQKCGTQKEISNTLAYLWDTIASPIVDRLDELHVAKGSRIWWCPTAELCALPLHAAGRGKRNVHDLYISSYTPTLSALIRARAKITQSPKIPKLLIIGQPSIDLARVVDEVDIIKNLRSDVDTVEVLFGPEANREAVLAKLKAHSWVHFACHGLLGDKDQPFHASFKLDEEVDRRLLLLDLIQARLPSAELAFLSACHSAAGGLSTPDESIHLSAALQFCGFKSVVGTLWEMDDEDGPMISEKFYKHMYRNPEKIDFKDSARALNSAIREMRKEKVPPERLAMFVHIGA